MVPESDAGAGGRGWRMADKDTGRRVSVALLGPALHACGLHKRVACGDLSTPTYCRAEGATSDSLVMSLLPWVVSAWASSCV